jgi:hypothetical protein
LLGDDSAAACRRNGIVRFWAFERCYSASNGDLRRWLRLAGSRRVRDRHVEAPAMKRIFMAGLRPGHENGVTSDWRRHWPPHHPALVAPLIDRHSAGDAIGC